jgi:hypothetical protein
MDSPKPATWCQLAGHERYNREVRISLSPLCRLVPGLLAPLRTWIDAIELERPYFYCRCYRHASYPFDEVWGLSAGRLQLDVQQATADLVTELPYDTASTTFGNLSRIAVSSAVARGQTFAFICWMAAGQSHYDSP